MSARPAAMVLAAALAAGGCATERNVSLAPLAVPAGVRVASAAALLTPEFMAAAAAVFFVYDPFAPNWDIRVETLDSERVRMQLRLKALHSGGDGEARQVFLRNVRRMVEEGGYAGYDIVQWEEGIESSRPFARRIATGEVRLVHSHILPAY